MEENLSDTVTKLNRLSKLYRMALQHLKPYRVSKQRSMLSDFLREIKDSQILALNSDNYDSVLKKQPLIEKIKQEKQKAIEENNLELAAQYRDKEKVLIKKLLISSHFIDASALYFGYEGKIYKL